MNNGARTCPGRATVRAASLPGFEPWVLNAYPYTVGGWLITRGGPWAPGEAERIIASVQNKELGAHIVADHNVHAAAIPIIRKTAHGT